MRILNILFKNINSLEGENRIDFEQSPFSDTGVFAITGPNGSGKSSILDAITLGLYGETFRFDRPAEFVMTQHTTECFSEVEFALGSDKYRSSWHIQRTENHPDGELQSAQMQLIRLADNQLLASTAQQVCAGITELTGMNFRNFTRSILLAQGDFSAFLNALDSERMDILEKIIGTDIYADYKKEVSDKANAAQIAIERIKQELAAIVLMAPKKREACQHDLLDYQEQYTEWQQEQNALEQQQVVLSHVAALEHQVAEQKHRLEAIEIQITDTQASLDKIDAVQNALLFNDDLAAIDNKTQLIQQGKANLKSLQTELLQIKNQLGDNTAMPDGAADKVFSDQKQTIDEIRAEVNQLRSNRQAEDVLLQSLAMQQTEKKTAIASVDAWLQEHATDESLLANFPETAKLKKLKAELADLTEQQKTFNKWLKNTVSSLKTASASLDKEKLKATELKQQLETNENELKQVLKGYDPEAIDDLKREQQERVKAFQELYDLAVAHQKLSKRGFGLFTLFKRQDEPEGDADALSLELEKIIQEISREENIKRALDELVTREALLKKMTIDRVHLIDGKPCPLCGALQHPFAKRPPVSTDSHQALLDQQAKLKGLSVSADRIRHHIISAQKNTEKNTHKQNQLQQLRSRWLGLCNRLNTASIELSINNLKLMQQLLDNETNELKNIVVLDSKYHSKKAAIVKLKGIIEKNQAAIEQWQIKVEQFDADTGGRYQEQEDLETALNVCRDEAHDLAEKVMKQLTDLGEKMPVKGKEDAFFDRLNVRRQDYHGSIFRRKGLVEEIAVLEAKQQDCQTEISRYDNRLEIYLGRLQKEEVVGLHLALIEKQKLIADKQQILGQHEAELVTLNLALEQKIQTTQFTNLHELTAALKLLESQSALKQHKTTLMQNKVTITAELDNQSALLNTELILIKGALSAEDIRLALKAIPEKMELAKLECQHLEKLLQDQQRLQQHYDTLIAQLQYEETQAEPCFAELAQITEENGMNFRRRVQSRLATKLLSQTNAILEKISGRYYLRQTASEQGLALEIEDTYQGNARRLPKTLSGGESFVVSLALALGLSELANNGKSVDSLFLDEGFGNLDADSLYTVISTLESLQTHGKTVGVISHVEAVQKRIKAQLQVVKKPNGFGELRKAS